MVQQSLACEEPQFQTKFNPWIKVEMRCSQEAEDLDCLVVSGLSGGMRVRGEGDKRVHASTPAQAY